MLRLELTVTSDPWVLGVVGEAVDWSAKESKQEATTRPGGKHIAVEIDQKFRPTIIAMT